MASYNKVILMGNLTRDPELRFTANNTAICKFGLAVNRRFKDSQTGEWKEEPTFVDVTIFGARAEPFARYHTKGKPAFIEGTLRLDTWEDKNGGGKRSKLYVVADTWEFVGQGARGAEAGGGERTMGGTGGGNGGGAGGAPSDASSGREPEYLQADDTPFLAFAPMDLTVRLFAVLKERAGRAEIALTGLPEDIDLRALKREIGRRHPELGDLSSVASAVGTHYASDETRLKTGDVVALLPPVSGG